MRKLRPRETVLFKNHSFTKYQRYQNRIEIELKSMG